MNINFSPRIRNNFVSVIKSYRSIFWREAGAFPPVLVTGEGRSGTTWVGEAIAAGLRGRLVFEPFWWEYAYPFVRVTGPGILNFEESDGALYSIVDRVLHGPLPYNHYVDRFVRGRQFNLRVVKALRLNHCLGEVLSKFQDIVLLHIVRNPFDSVRSQIELDLPGQLVMSQRYNRFLVESPYLRKRIPWLSLVRPDYGSVAQLKLFAWMVSHYLVHMDIHAHPRACIVRYRDLLLAAPKAMANISAFLVKHGYNFEECAIDLRRPSGTTTRNERAAVIAGQPEHKSRGYFAPRERESMLRLLYEAGMLDSSGRDVFGQELAVG
jgi:hypothetical protein